MSVLRHKAILVPLILFAANGALSAQGTVEVTTLAGIARSSGFVDGQGPGARFQYPGELAVDSLGHVKVADINPTGGYSIRNITPSGFVTTTSIATPTDGFRLASDGIGNLYVSTIRAIDKYTPGGQRIPINTGSIPLGGPIAADLSGNLYVGAGSTLYKMSSASTVTSTQTNVALNSIVVNAAGTAYIAGRNAIFIYTPGGRAEQLVGAGGNSGSADGVGAAARFGENLSLAIDAEGNLYVADTDNSTIRKVSLVPYGTGFRPESVSTIAGRAGSTGSQDGTGSNARFLNPTAITVDQVSGTIYVSDSGNRTIRKITGAANPAITPPRPSGTPLPIPEVENGPIQSGYVILTTDSGTTTPSAVVSYGLVQNGAVQSKAGVLPALLSTSASAVVEVVGGIGRNFGIALANPNATANSVTLTLKDENGAIVGISSILTIDPYKQVARFITDLFPANVIGPSLIGSVSLDSPTPFVPLGLTFTGAVFSTIALNSTPTASAIPIRSLSAGTVPDTPRQGIVGGPGSVMFPQFAFGGGWATQIALVNTGTSTATGRIDLFDSEGRPAAVKLNGSMKSTFTYSIPAGGTLILAPRDQNGQSPL